MKLTEHEAEFVAMTETRDLERLGCNDCARPYGAEYGFPDLIIPYWAWKEISPSGDDGGLLCPSCICNRLHDRGIRCEGAFTSGPIISVSEPTMNALRRVENIELAIEGRQNAMAAITDILGEREGWSTDAARAALQEEQR